MERLTANPYNQELGSCPQWYQDLVAGMMARAMQIPREITEDEERAIRQNMKLLYGSKFDDISEVYDDLRGV